MTGQRKAGAVLAYLGFVMEHESDRSNNVLDRAVLQCDRHACQIFAKRIAAGRVKEEHWSYLAGIEAPPVPEEKPKERHKPVRPYSSHWDERMVYPDETEELDIPAGELGAT
jgi:hypothetical protein